MLEAKSIARGDPAGGGTAGNYLAGALEKLGLLEATREKSILRVGGYNVMKEVAERRADFGLTQSTEITAVAGVKIGAWLPADIQLTTLYALARCTRAPHSYNARHFLDFVTGTKGRAAIARAGFAAP
jgi:molybdate transport system substrate-binding protein